MDSEISELEEEIDSWKGLPWALRREDRELWDEMIREVRESCTDAIEHSGKSLTVDPLFMTLLLAQQKIILRLKAELGHRVPHGIRVSPEPTSSNPPRNEPVVT